MTDLRRTHCKRGHALVDENVFRRKDGGVGCCDCRYLNNRKLKEQSAGRQIRYGRRKRGTNILFIRGHLLAGDNLYVRSNGVRECRACIRQTKLKWLRSGELRLETVRRIVEALHEGKTLTRISGQEKHDYVGDAICSHYFVKKHPKFGRQIVRLAKHNRQEARVRSCQLRRTRISIALAKNDGIDAFTAIAAATENLLDHLKDEIRSAMFLAVAEGRLNPRGAASSVREFVAAHNRQYSKYIPHGGGIMQSLDQQVCDDGPTRLIDTVTHGLGTDHSLQSRTAQP